MLVVEVVLIGMMYFVYFTNAGDFCWIFASSVGVLNKKRPSLLWKRRGPLVKLHIYFNCQLVTLLSDAEETVGDLLNVTSISCETVSTYN